MLHFFFSQDKWLSLASNLPNQDAARICRKRIRIPVPWWFCIEDRCSILFFRIQGNWIPWPPSHACPNGSSKKPFPLQEKPWTKTQCAVPSATCFNSPSLVPTTWLTDIPTSASNQARVTPLTLRHSCWNWIFLLRAFAHFVHLGDSELLCNRYSKHIVYLKRDSILLLGKLYLKILFFTI